jgi:hypothetical protein
MLLGRLLPDPTEPKAILDHLEQAIASQAAQSRIAQLEAVISRTKGDVFYNITYRVKYQGHQSPAVRHFGEQYFVRGVEILEINISPTDKRSAGRLDPPQRPADARSVFGGGWEWDAERLITISIPVPKRK